MATIRVFYRDWDHETHKPTEAHTDYPDTFIKIDGEGVLLILQHGVPIAAYAYGHWDRAIAVDERAAAAGLEEATGATVVVAGIPFTKIGDSPFPEADPAKDKYSVASMADLSDQGDQAEKLAEVAARSGTRHTRWRSSSIPS